MKTFYIESSHTVEEDKWEEGCTGEMHSQYELNAVVTAENWKDAIQKYIENELGYDVDMDNLQVTDEGDAIDYSVLTDEDNLYHSDEQYDLWKKGKYKLYSNDIRMWIYEQIQVEL